MPVTKREKQLMLPLRGEDFEDPAVASFGNEKILPFIATSGMSGTRFLRHSGGHVSTVIEEEVTEDDEGRPQHWWTVTKVVTGGYVLYCLYVVIQIALVVYAIGAAAMLTGDSDPDLNPGAFVLCPFRRGARFTLHIIDGIFPLGTAAIDFSDWEAIKEVLQRAYSLLSCKVVGGCVSTLVEMYNPNAGPMPFTTDVVSLASSVATTRYFCFGCKRGADEDRVTYNARSLRDIRLWVCNNGIERWSTKVLRLQLQLMGHWARRWEGDVRCLACRMQMWRSLEWWQKEQSLSQTGGGKRHPGCFRAANTERSMATALGVKWVAAANNRDGWRQLLKMWLAREDVAWSRDRQIALEF